MEESVTIRGFTCKAGEAPIVNEIIRIVEQEEPRLGTVYSVKNGKNGMLKAAICGPYENGTKAARGVFLMLWEKEGHLKRCRYIGNRGNKRQYSCSPVDPKVGLGANFFGKLKTSRERAKELLHDGDSR